MKRVVSYLVPFTEEVSVSFLLSLDDLLLGGLGPQQAVLFLMDFRLSYLHHLEVVAVSASSQLTLWHSQQICRLNSSGCTLIKSKLWGFPSSPLVKTLCFQCKGYGSVWSLDKELRSHKSNLKSPWQPFYICLFQWKYRITPRLSLLFCSIDIKWGGIHDTSKLYGDQIGTIFLVFWWKQEWGGQVNRNSSSSSFPSLLQLSVTGIMRLVWDFWYGPIAMYTMIILYDPHDFLSCSDNYSNNYI